MADAHKQWMRYDEEIKAAGSFVDNRGLGRPDVATTVRVRDGETQLTDGPFAETKEYLAGFYLVEADDLDAAVEWAARIPSATYGSVEVRPMWGGGVGRSMTDEVAVGVERAFREERGAVLATLIRHLGDFQLAEDAVQDAFAVGRRHLAPRRRPRQTPAPGSRSPPAARRSTGCGASGRAPRASRSSPSSPRLDDQARRAQAPPGTPGAEGEDVAGVLPGEDVAGVFEMTGCG